MLLFSSDQALAWINNPPYDRIKHYMTTLLENIYDPEHFRKTGHELIDLLAEYLTSAYKGENLPVIAWKSAAEQLAFWEAYETEKPDATKLFRDLLTHSIHLHHKQYIGHQIAPTAPVAALANMLSSLLNNGMAVYEMGPAASALEKVVADVFIKAVGYGEEADGFLTSGGTLANLTGLLSARKAMAPSDVWAEGAQEKLALMVSEEAHYCVDRAVRIMGWGESGIIKIPVNDRYQMRTELLAEYYERAIAAGIKVIAVVGSACSTSTGAYDDLHVIAQFCKKQGLWLHVDGAHGGGAIFSPKYKQLLRGLEQADSIAIDIHKMLMAPALTTMLLFRNKQHAYQTFNQTAQYLWEQAGEAEWYNLAKRNFECTKHMMSAKVFTMLHLYGTQGFNDFVTSLYDMGKTFAALISQSASFQLATPPQANIVCFRYVEKELAKGSLNLLNSRIRKELLEQGDFYIVQTLLHGDVYLRTTIMNPFTTAQELEKLLRQIANIALRIIDNLKTEVS